MFRSLALLAAVIAASTIADVAAAQTIVSGPGGMIVVPSGFTPGYQGTYGRSRYIPPTHGQHPVYVTPNEVIGINPNTGGVDTSNRQIDNTVNQVGRDASQHNGTKRWVRRPVHNAQGQVVGYQEGYVWNNSITGQEHGELTNFTPNQGGGVHKNIQSQSVQPSGGRPQAKPGVHRNFQSYGAAAR